MESPRDDSRSVGKPQVILGTAVRIARIGPDASGYRNVVLRPNLGVALWRKGDLDGAIAEYLEALRLKPDYVDAHNSLGLAFQGKGDLNSAIVAYREALRLSQTPPTRTTTSATRSGGKGT